MKHMSEGADQGGAAASTDALLPGLPAADERCGLAACTPPRRLFLPLHRIALFLDIDGTLAPITARPEFTRVPVATRRILLGLQARGAALAALSGRPLPQARRLLYPLEIALGGSHGAHISPAAGRSIRMAAAPPAGMMGMLRQGVERLPGVWLECKPGAFAVHWRQAPQQRLEVAGLAHRALGLAPGWRLLEGHCVHELRPAGRDKGLALIRLMRQPGFVGRWPLAIGDDRTDEDAFQAALSLGGGAMRVGEQQDTAAPWVLPDVATLALWLGSQLRGR